MSNRSQENTANHLSLPTTTNVVKNKVESEKKVKRGPVNAYADEVFTLAESKTDDSFCNSFKAVGHKRYLLYKNSRRYIFLDFCLPLLFMVLGIWITTFESFSRSPTEILGPERMGFDNQLILFDKGDKRKSNSKTIEEIANFMPGKGKELNI